jgi:hypothetical protein
VPEMLCFRVREPTDVAAAVVRTEWLALDSMCVAPTVARIKNISKGSIYSLSLK